MRATVVSMAFLPHAQESRAQACHEVREPTGNAHVLLQPCDHGDVAAAHRISREPGAELHPSRVGELIVPRHDAGVERDPHHASRWRVGSLDGLRGKAGPAGDGGADERENQTEGLHQQNGTRQMADAVFATPWHRWSSSGHGRDRRAVLGVDGSDNFSRNLLLRRLVRVDAVATERQPERRAAA